LSEQRHVRTTIRVANDYKRSVEITRKLNPLEDTSEPHLFFPVTIRVVWRNWDDDSSSHYSTDAVMLR
jgi:hypothetical protein